MIIKHSNLPILHARSLRILVHIPATYRSTCQTLFQLYRQTKGMAFRGNSDQNIGVNAITKNKVHLHLETKHTTITHTRNYYQITDL